MESGKRGRDIGVNTWIKEARKRKESGAVSTIAQ